MDIWTHYPMNNSAASHDIMSLSCLPYPYTSLTEYITDLIQLLSQPISCILLNQHIVQSLCIDTWSTLPQEWQTALLDTPTDMYTLQSIIYSYTDIMDQQSIHNIQSILPPHWPHSLQQYIVTILQLRLCRQSTQYSHINVHYPNGTKPSKKLHEIKLMSYAVDQLHQDNHSQPVVVDVGSGVGYLCHELSINYKYNTLGIEQRQHNIDRSCIRYNNLQSHGQYKHNTVCGQYKSYCTYVDNHTDIDTIVQRQYNHSLPYTLVGLHCCGDLTSTLIDKFVHSNNVQNLAVVSCCYHRITDTANNTCTQHSSNQCNHTSSTPCHGFPLSRHVQHAKYRLTQTSKSFLWKPGNCANDTIYRNKLLVIRCLFEYLLYIHYKHIYLMHPDDRSIGSTQQYIDSLQNTGDNDLCDIFIQYTIYVLHKLQKQYPSIIVLSESQLHEFYAHNQYKLSYMHWLFWFQSMITQLIEGLIVCDRLQYIHEHNIDGTIISIFDSLISNRNLLIVAQKKHQSTHNVPHSRNTRAESIMLDIPLNNDIDELNTLIGQLNQRPTTKLNTNRAIQFKPVELEHIIHTHTGNVDSDELHTLQLPDHNGWNTVQQYINAAQHKMSNKSF